jgi:acyl-CoA thioester hydrolase
VPLTTRWNDNDPYGHLNNVAYYAFFDAAVNGILVEAGLLDPESSPVIGVIAESHCRFHSSLSFPDPIEVGVAVEHLGRSSVRYRVAAFKAGAARASAEGRYTHVYVERSTGRPASIPAAHRRLMETMAPG